MKKEIRKKIPKEISIKQEVRFGKPTVENTRVTIEDILHLVRAGYSVEDIPRQYPNVSKEGTIAALNYAANVLGKEEILLIGE